MARRKSTKKTTRRRSRRRGVGSANTTDMLMNAGFVILGAAVGGVLTKTVLSGKSQMIQAGVKIAGGVALGMFVKSDLGKFASMGLIAAGGTDLLKKFNIAGVGDDMVPLQISGDGLSLLAGANDEDFAMAGLGDDDDDGMAGDELRVLAGMGMFEED
jgi:hypothetical protein